MKAYSLMFIHYVCHTKILQISFFFHIFFLQPNNFLYFCHVYWLVLIKNEDTTD